MQIVKFIYCAGLFFSIVTGRVAMAEQEPPLFNATYSLFSSGLEIAQMERTMRKQGEDEYLYSSNTSTVGLVAVFHKDHIVEESRWKLVDNQVRPLVYTYQRSRGKKDRRINIQFDWDNKLINNVVNERRKQMPLEEGMLDKLLYQYALMRDLLNNQPEIAYDVTDGGKMKKYNFDRMEEEVVHTPLGDLQTVKLQKVKHDDTSKLIIWSAPSLGYLPVKVESTDEDGRATIAIIQSLTWLQSPPAY